MKIRAIIFDIGGVLCKGIDKVHSNLAESFNLTSQELHDSIRKYSVNATIGKLSARGFQRLVAKNLGIKDAKRFMQRWDSLLKKHLSIDRRIEKTIKILKKRYIVGALTDVAKITDKARIKKKMYKHFKIKIKSCEAGFKKPDLRIYRLLVKKLNTMPEEVIFIDDKKECLMPAKNLGMKTILFRNNKQLINDLKRRGIKI